jgi:hypothetical protein
LDGEYRADVPRPTRGRGGRREQEPQESEKKNEKKGTTCEAKGEKEEKKVASDGKRKPAERVITLTSGAEESGGGDEPRALEVNVELAEQVDPVAVAHHVAALPCRRPVRFLFGRGNHFFDFFASREDASRCKSRSRAPGVSGRRAPAPASRTGRGTLASPLSLRESR